MAASVEAICEMALGHLGVAQSVAALDTDQTAVATALRRFYLPALTEVHEDHPWTFCKRYYDLLEQPGLGTVTVAGNVATFSVDQDDDLHEGDTITIEGVEYVIGARTSATVWATDGDDVAASAFTIAKARTDEPTRDWAYGFRLPSRVLVARRLVDGNRTPIRSNWPVHDILEDDDGRLLLTDEWEPVLEYTELVTTTTRFTALFDLALSYLLAFRVAALVTKGDPNKLGPRCFQLYTDAIARAQARDANESRRDDEPDAELIQAR